MRATPVRLCVSSAGATNVTRPARSFPSIETTRAGWPMRTYGRSAS